MRNQFANLPLKNVVIRVAVPRRLPASLEFFCDVLAEMRPFGFTTLADPRWRDSPPGLVPILEVGPTHPYAMLQSRDAILIVGPRVLSARWNQDYCEAPYPRFERIREVLLGAVEVCGNLLGPVVVDTANMNYLNLVGQSSGSYRIGELIRGFEPPHEAVPPGSLKEVCMVWQEQNHGVELRVESKYVLQSDRSPSLIIDTGAGVHADGRPLPERVDAMHTALNELFPTILTDEAKRLFAYDSSL